MAEKYILSAASYSIQTLTSSAQDFEQLKVLHADPLSVTREVRWWQKENTTIKTCSIQSRYIPVSTEGHV